MKNWVAKKKMKKKPLKNSKQSTKLLPKNSKSPSTETKSGPEKLLPVKCNSVPVNTKLPPSSLELIDPAIIFTPERKKECSINLVINLYKLLAYII